MSSLTTNTVPVTLQIPQRLAEAFGIDPATLGRRAVERLVAEAYARELISHKEVGEILSLDRFQTDSFLKEQQAFRLFAAEEFSHDLETIRRVGK